MALPDSITWAYLQEKLTTTTYGPPGAPEVFKFPVFLNTIQSALAALSGAVYLIASTPRGQPVPPIIPNSAILKPLALVTITSVLASPFGYASLAHIDYITFLLAKSCKLLPVMFLHITLFRKRYPLSKYLVVAAVTAGVAVFTLHSGGRKRRAHKVPTSTGQTAWGLLLLVINLLFDGLTNSTQDYIFATFRPYSGPQMMCANNMMATAVTAAYLLLSPWLVGTGLGRWFGMDVVAGAGELAGALDFLARYPRVWWDVLGFAACGAFGQVFICKLQQNMPPHHPLPPYCDNSQTTNSTFHLVHSLHARDLLVRAPRHHHRHAQDGHHDGVGRGLRPPALAHAVAGRRARVRRHRRRGLHHAPREARQGGGEEAGCRCGEGGEGGVKEWEGQGTLARGGYGGWKGEVEWFWGRIRLVAVA